MPRSVFAALVLPLLLGCGLAQAQIRIGAIASSTGVSAVVGIPQKNTVALLPREIAGQRVDYVVLDDASDPTNAVTAVKKLLAEHGVDGLIGPTTTPSALAILDFVAEARVPLVTTVGSSSLVLPMDEKAGIRIVANERYTRTDQSVTGQTLKLLAARPDAVFVAATGGPAVLLATIPSRPLSSSRSLT